MFGFLFEFWEITKTVTHEITGGFNSIVEMLQFLDYKLKTFTLMLNGVQMVHTHTCPEGYEICSLIADDAFIPPNLSEATQMTILMNWLSAFKFVVGSYIFNVTIIMIALSCAFTIFKSIRTLYVALKGDKGLLEGTGILKYVKRLFGK